jgi:hypothetical protein
LRAIAHLRAQRLPVVKLLRVHARLSALFKPCGQVVLQIAGKQHAALFKIITVAQQALRSPGSTRT